MPILRHRNNQLFLDNSPLQTDVIQSSFLAEPGSIGDAQIFLQDYTGFLDNQILYIEDFGTESAEIVTVNGTPTVNAGAVLDSVLVRSHPVGSKVYIVAYDQIELSHATTATGSKTLLTTTIGSGIVAIQPDTKIQTYSETQFTSGYYFARYKHSISAAFSDYCDYVLYGGADKNTVAYIIERALRDNDEGFSPKVTFWDCLEWINSGMKLIQGKLRRWPEHYSYNAILGQVSRGTNTITMPTDAYDTETNKSIIGFRIGINTNLQYLDPVTFDDQLDQVAKTTSRAQALAADTSLNITNSYDFTDSGTVHVYVSGTQYAITYTGVTRDTATGATGALTGVPASGTGSITVTIPSGTNVWQNEVESTPTAFTVRNGSLEFWPLADSTNDNTNAYGDYAKVATSVDSAGDTIDFQRYDMLQSYLTYRIWAKAKNSGALDEQNGYWTEFRTRLNDTIRTLPNNNRFRMSPMINTMKRTGRGEFDWIQNLDVTDQ